MLGRLSFISATVSVTPSPTMPSSKRLPGPDHVGRQNQFRVRREICLQLFFGQVYPVADDAREDHLQRRPLLHRRNACQLLWWLDGCDLGLRRKVERDAHDVGVLDIEQSIVIQVIGVAAQTATDDLFAEELSAESSDPENMGHGICVPAFRQHGDGDDAANLLPESALLPNGVHHLAQEVGVGQFSYLARSGSLRDLALVLFNFERSRPAEIIVQRFAGFELLAVDQERVGASETVAVLVKIAE